MSPYQTYPFSGTYSSDDIRFLLNPAARISYVPLEEKERCIQNGTRHYSDMLSREEPPSDEHIRIFQEVMRREAGRLAKETLSLAKAIADRSDGRKIILASIVRAGCPLGVLLKRGLNFLGHKDAPHFGISIIRDRGMDNLARAYLKTFKNSDIYFVDGWTGKGAISRELERSWPGAKLVVLSDICGCAYLSASHDDWLIPFGILGAPINGLISRTLWAEDSYHCCKFLDFLQPHDVSNDFVNTISAMWTENDQLLDISPNTHENKKMLQQQSAEAVQCVMRDFGVENAHRVKPGIAEATRAVMRRVPHAVCVSDILDPDLALLLHLARKRGIKVVTYGEKIAPYRAITVIKSCRT